MTEMQSKYSMGAVEQGWRFGNGHGRLLLMLAQIGMVKISPYHVMIRGRDFGSRLDLLHAQVRFIVDSCSLET